MHQETEIVTIYSEYFTQNWPLLQQRDLYNPTTNPTWNNPDWRDAALKVLILRLSPYRDVDRSTPHLFLHQAARHTLPLAFIETAFFPPEHDRKRLRDAGIPFITGILSNASLDEFDVILISNAYTLELINLYTILLDSGIPLWASDRGEHSPLLILGGSNAMASQAIISENADSLVDAVFFGEGEGMVEHLLKCLYTCRHLTKSERLGRAAATTQGLWVSGEWPDEPIHVATATVAPGSHSLTDYPVLNGAQASTARLQIDIGCPAFCSFCFEGYDRKPYRAIQREEVLRNARRLKETHGCDNLEIYSFNFNSHPDILELLLDLNQLFGRVHAKSQRVDLLDTTPGLLEAEIIADKRSFTLGIEGISASTRAFLHKSLSTDSVVRVIRSLLSRKIRQLKLFFILTGYETEEDINEFRAFVRGIRSSLPKANTGVRITFSAGLLIRMPFTPLQYSSLLLDREHWHPIIEAVKSTCETNGFEFRLAVDWDEYCTSQVMAIGGNWLSRPLEELARQGHVYDLRLSKGYWASLEKWMKANGYWATDFMGEKPSQYPFALGFVKPAVSPDFLYQQYVAARNHVDNGYCLGTADAPAKCLGCSACRTDANRAAILEHAPHPPGRDNSTVRLRETMTAKAHLSPIAARLFLPPHFHGASPEWLNALVLRSLLKRYPSLTDNLLAAKEALFTFGTSSSQYPSMTGETIFNLTAWNAQAVIEALGPAPQTLADGVELRVIEDAFTPGTFRHADIRLSLPGHSFPDVRTGLLQFLRDSHIPVNLRREESSQSLILDLPAKALKKRVLLEGQLIESGEGTQLLMVCTPKFRLLDFLVSLSIPDAFHRLAVAEVTHLEL
ncbi:MAG: radical SAM protein [Anaerolineae bacterium]|nr:radical SAM protein [Anaerolineae bacterium]